MRVPPPRRRCADLPFKVTVRVAKDGQIEVARPNRTLAVLCAPAHRTACSRSSIPYMLVALRRPAAMASARSRAATNTPGYDQPTGLGKRILRPNPKL